MPYCLRCGMNRVRTNLHLTPGIEGDSGKHSLNTISQF